MRRTIAVKNYCALQYPPSTALDYLSFFSPYGRRS